MRAPLLLTKKKKNFKSAAIQLCVVATAWLACGCSNGPGGSGAEQVNSSNYSSGYYDNDIQPNGTTTSNGFNCPELPNVLPNAASEAIFTDRWSVCQGVNNTSTIEFTGTATESQVCVFPVETQNSAVYSRPDPQTGLPMYECVAPSTTAAYVSFANITYNAVFIVELTNVNQMQTCIYTADWTQCPAYSYGEFR